MTTVQIGNRTFDVAAIAFDKDGTLVEFSQLWDTRTQRWIDRLVALAGGDSTLRTGLGAAVGFDGRHVLPDSPMAVGTMAQLYTLMAGALYQHGMGWHAAEMLVEHSAQLFAEPPTPDELHPTGQLPSLFAELTAAGVQLAINTSDNRIGTLATLDMLGISSYIGAIVCGDDGLPAKPDPTSLETIAKTLSVSPSQMLFVGDTMSDLTTGKRAGALGTVGILGGGSDEAALWNSADVVVRSLDEIKVVRKGLSNALVV